MLSLREISKVFEIIKKIINQDIESTLTQSNKTTRYITPLCKIHAFDIVPDSNTKFEVTLSDNMIYYPSGMLYFDKVLIPTVDYTDESLFQLETMYEPSFVMNCMLKAYFKNTMPMMHIEISDYKTLLETYKD